MKHLLILLFSLFSIISQAQTIRIVNSDRQKVDSLLVRNDSLVLQIENDIKRSTYLGNLSGLGDNLGDHVATTDLNMSSNQITQALSLDVGQITGNAGFLALDDDVSISGDLLMTAGTFTTSGEKRVNDQNLTTPLDWLTGVSGDEYYWSSENSSGSETFTKRYQLNPTGTPTNGADLVTKAYADATYTGGGGGSEDVILTQAEYDALGSPDPTVTYFIKDAPSTSAPAELAYNFQSNTGSITLADSDIVLSGSKVWTRFTTNDTITVPTGITNLYVPFGLEALADSIYIKKGVGVDFYVEGVTGAITTDGLVAYTRSPISGVFDGANSVSFYGNVTQYTEPVAPSYGIVASADIAELRFYVTSQEVASQSDGAEVNLTDLKGNVIPVTDNLVVEKTGTSRTAVEGYIDLGTDTDVRFASTVDWTFCGCYAEPFGASQTFVAIRDKSVSPTNADVETGIYPLSSTEFFIMLYNGAGSGSITGVGPLTDGDLFCATFDASVDTVELFINGVSEGTRTGQTGTLTVPTDPFVIHAEKDGAGYFFSYPGAWYEFMVFAKELTPTEQVNIKADLDAQTN